jgi:thymidine kinase
MGENTGKLVVLAGPMYAGKTTKLLKTTRDKDTLLFKPSEDDRYSEDDIVSHKGRKRRCIVVDAEEGKQQLLDAVKRENPDTIGIDETHLFHDWLADAVAELRSDHEVYVTGLDRDFRGEHFDLVRELMQEADAVEKLFARCEECDERATHTQRLIDGDPAPYDAPVIQVGGKELYEARCEECHEVPGSDDKAQ